MYNFEESSDLSRFIQAHTSKESDLLRELDRATHLKVLHPRMLSGKVQGRMLSMISKMIRPECILEIGTFTAYSALCLAEGLQSGGRLVSIEINDELNAFAASFVERSVYKKNIELLTGNAIQLVPKLNQLFDLVFIDGDKREYPQYYEVVMEKVKPGGFILADNILWNGKVVEELDSNDKHTEAILKFNKRVQEDQRVENVILPIRDGLMLMRKKDD